MEGDIRGGELAAGFLHPYHGSTVDTRFSGHLVVVAVISDDLHCRTVATVDSDTKALFNLHRIEDTDYVSLLIDLRAEGFLEGSHIAVGALAHHLRRCIFLHRRGSRACPVLIRRVVLVGVYRMSATGHQGLRCHIDGVAVFTGLHVDGQREFLRHLIEAALQHNLNLADVSKTLDIRITTSAVEGELHIQHRRSTTVEGAYQEAVRRVIVTEIDGPWVLPARTVAVARRGRMVRGLQVIEIDVRHVDMRPANGAGNLAREVVGRDDIDGETVPVVGGCTHDGALSSHKVELVTLH